MLKLSVDEYDALRDLLHHPGYKPLMRAIEAHVKLAQDDVIKWDSAQEEKTLVKLACRAEGAAKLLWSIERYLQGLKSKKES